MTGQGAVFALVGVRRVYGKGPAALDVLQGVDLKVLAGDFVAIMGASGTGKSTLMNIIGLLDRPSAGECWVKGRDTAALDDLALARLRNKTIGFVFQSFHLLGRLNAWQNVALPLLYRGARARERKRRAQAILARVGLAERSGYRPGELSGGQCQRVAIARALVGSPEIVLADEPTGALDETTGAEIMDLLKQLNSSEGTTIVIITHDRAIAEHCHRRLRLREGRLREEKRPTEPLR